MPGSCGSDNEGRLFPLSFSSTSTDMRSPAGISDSSGQTKFALQSSAVVKAMLGERKTPRSCSFACCHCWKRIPPTANRRPPIVAMTVTANARPACKLTLSDIDAIAIVPKDRPQRMAPHPQLTTCEVVPPSLTNILSKESVVSANSNINKTATGAGFPRKDLSTTYTKSGFA